MNHRLLYLFALADNRGRKSLDSSRSEETLSLWKMVAEENNCFGQPFAFANDHARFLFYRNQLSSLYYVPHEAFRCRVTMMCGLPGAGKDYWLAKNRTDLPVVSLDDLRMLFDIDPTDNQGTILQLGREKCREYLRAGQDFAYNATNILKQTRSRWIDLFADYQARIEIVYIEPPLSVVLKNNAGRNKPVPSDVIKRLHEKLEPPTLCEAHSLKVVG